VKENEFTLLKYVLKQDPFTDIDIKYIDSINTVYLILLARALNIYSVVLLCSKLETLLRDR
jgi:hypothetical protein